MKAPGILSKRFRLYNQSDGPSGVGETGTDEASDASRPENRVVQAGISHQLFFAVAAGRHSRISASLSVWSLDLAR